MTDYQHLDRYECLRAIARVKLAAARAEPVLARRCGPVVGELGVGPEEAVRLMAEVLEDTPEVLALRASALRLILAARAYVDFGVLELPTFSAAALSVFIDEVKAGRVPPVAGGRVRARL